MFQTFLAGFGGVGGACALITLGLKVWPGALDALATGLYSHVQPERLPYDSPLSQHFAKTRTLGERTSKIDDRMDELCRDTIKNTIISLIYGDRSHDHSEAVRYEGSSPRMRGTLHRDDDGEFGYGIIPAYAGNTLADSKPPNYGGDHPRVCGEHP